MSEDSPSNSDMSPGPSGGDLAAQARHYQALIAYRKILRLIHGEGLTIGDRLPPQSELLRRFESCHSTVGKAMGWLVADGILKRRQRSGTVVTALFPRNSLRKIWTVGIVSPSFQASPFFPVLAHFLHRHLALSNCTDRTYMLSPTSPNGAEVDDRQAKDFTGLAEDIDGHLIDGVVTATRLVNHQIPVCGVAAWETSDFGVVIDQGVFVRRAAQELVRRGSAHIALVAPNAVHHYFPRLKDGYADAVGEFPNCRFSRFSLAATSGIRGGIEVGGHLLRLSREERPDGLIIQDDMMAQGLTLRLREAGEYVPRCVVQTHLQTPSIFSLPIIPFEIDLEDLAARAASQLIAKMVNPDSKAELDWYEPVLRKCDSLGIELHHTEKLPI